MPRKWSKHLERPEVWFYIFSWKATAFPRRPSIAVTQNIYLLNQQTPLLSALWTLPSKCSLGPISFNSSNLSRLQIGAWKIKCSFQVHKSSYHTWSKSALFRALAETFTRTSPSPGCGFVTSFTYRFSGPPGQSKQAANILSEKQNKTQHEFRQLENLGKQ